ncbi:TfoX/Sxy family DNA transformation protein [Frigidibacter mobilis]|uniref:TfoX domain-containing protein n=1 Tax=Frigidibacter mobilis TaxID=1335048 RepID=A0A161GM78_9RHOB|nr:TfoX/Sxy family DNA transformation protein [Frigidibacter mobilis]AMY69723.1 TfoX domain-containing protein [Frigidibacter mobilis]
MPPVRPRAASLATGILGPAPDPLRPGSAPRPVSVLPNLGPAAEAEFARVGIASAEALIALGADAAYARLLAGGTRPHFIMYYALVMGLQGRPWNDCRGAEKDALRTRFDAIKARGAGNDEGRSRMEAALDALGVRPARG